LLVSFYFDLPSGPAIIISIGIVCVSSILFGSNGGLLKKQVSQRHLAG
jgi:zinc/manganese transport system permease protein